ncbi:MAG: TIGR00282 family metallophosphoesterase [Oscillospiraceae bacterium]|nr:TIGR00282 family metallophosphoesterase [Oscillospiraceae bacterium]
MKLLFIGDIMGRTGRDAVFGLLPEIKARYSVDFCIANGENASGGLGMNRAGYDELRRAGVDFFTMGNHTFSKKEICTLYNEGENLVRPANLHHDCPGEGMAVITAKNGYKIAIINLIGRAFMDPSDHNPFIVARELAEKAAKSTPMIFVDFHAEATSEKEAMGYHMDGIVSAVIGTHTHVQTADERILPKGTAYLTDAGRTGAVHSVLGLEPSASIARFMETEGKKPPFKVAGGEYMLCGAVIDIDEETGKAKEIIRICQYGK